MITVRRSEDRGRFDFGWLKTAHTFSFGDYRDPAWMGFRTLRVINDDVVAPGRGFDTHPHRDMEIVSYVLAGAIAHKDSMGNETVSGPGEAQRMSAGSGVLHSEHNASAREPLRLLQVWLRPRTRGNEPRYDRLLLSDEALRGRLCAIATGDGRERSMEIDQDAAMYATRLRAGDRVAHEIGPGRAVWVQAATGVVRVNGETLREGDGCALEDEPRLEMECAADAEALVFDLG